MNKFGRMWLGASAAVLLSLPTTAKAEIVQTENIAGETLNTIEVPSEEQPEETPQEQPEGIPQEQPEGTPQEQPEEIPQEQPEGIPQEQPEGTPQEQPEEIPQEQPEGTPQEQPEGIPQEQPEEIPQEQPEEIPQEQPEGTPQEQPEEIPQEQPEETPQEQSENISSTTEGWNHDGEDWYYVQGGEIVKDSVLQIGGKYYGFGYDGKMYKDSAFQIWDYENQQIIYYRANVDGVLYVNGWYDGEWGNKYYYGEDGVAYRGWNVVNGQNYYFYDDGQLCKNCVEKIDGVNYIFDENGYAIKAEDNAWTQVGEDWYYVQDGEIVKDSVLQISGKYYGFDYEGKMYKDVGFSFWDEAIQKYKYYRAKADGILYVNEWYEGWGNKYYYGERGVAYSGWEVIDGQKYYFGEDGLFYRNCAKKVDGINYIFDENGYAMEIKDSGWIQVGEEWYYIQDEEFVKDSILQISGKYYGFNYEGKMYKDVEFSFWDEVIQKDKYYRAKADGILYVNEWYEGWGNKYYYGEDGVAYSGWRVVGGLNCYFDSNGRFYQDCAEKIDEINYGFDENGCATKLEDNAWTKVGSNWFYVENGEIVKNSVMQIGGSYYGFDYNGKMYENCSFSIWNSETQEIKEYRAKANGVLSVEEWYLEGYVYYYYGKDGSMYKGIHTIDGQIYGFDDYGKMYRDTAEVINGENYVFDQNGYGTKLSNNTWTLINSEYYYVKDGILLKNGIFKIDGFYYGFDTHGKMGKGKFEIYNSETGKYNYYRANSSGVLYTNSWYRDGKVWYYYGEMGQAAIGYYNVNGTYYYFTFNGEMLTKSIAIDQNGRAYYVSESGEATLIEDGWAKNPNNDQWVYVENGKAVEKGIKKIGDASYAFAYYYMQAGCVYTYEDKNYLVQEDGIIRTSAGWNMLLGDWYYIKEDGTLHTGVLRDGGRIYFMKPQMAHNEQMIIAEDGKNYFADHNGYLFEIGTDGFYETTDSEVYYIYQGKVLKNTWHQVGGDWYYFAENGQRVSGSTYIGNKRYLFARDGKMYVNTWIRGYNTQYATETGELAIGEQLIDGTWYYFDKYGIMQKGVVNYNGVTYLYGEDGAYVGRIDLDGWNLVNGTYYYVSNGRALRNEVFKDESGNYYVFDDSGKMKKNTIASMYPANYYLDENGIAQKGWIYYGNAYYYGDPETARLVTNTEKEIGGQKYYFDNNGVMVTGDIYRDGKCYHYSQSGALTGVTDMQNGWTICGDKYFYYQGGKPYTGWIGDYYAENGVMQTGYAQDVSGKWYYLGADGRYFRNSWIKEELIDGFGDVVEWSYAKEDGSLAENEWLMVDGIWYYFDGKTCVKGYQNIGGVGYWFDENGKYLGEAGSDIKEGWIYKNGTYYYGHAGDIVKDQMLNIGGEWYYFDYDGKMIASREYEGWYFDADGKRVDYTGWKLINNKWQYFDSESHLIKGFVQVGNKWYYIDYFEGMVTGYCVVNSNLYYFDSDGVCIEKISMENGWYSANNEWYYFENGVPVMDGIRKINGATYAFADGKMVKNTDYYYKGQHIYFDQNGILVTQEGWYYIDDRGYIYVDANGQICTGVKQIGNTVYYFFEDGMWYNPSL